MHRQTIHLHIAAPHKPAPGAACNGCGVCCAAETCPAGRLIFRRRIGPCPALEWETDRYRCGLISHPAQYLPRFPERAEGGIARLFARWISTGSGCDSTAETETTEAS